jgi:hypothetical protein
MTFKEFGNIIPRIKTNAQAQWYSWTLAKFLGDKWNIDKINASQTAAENCRPRPVDRVADLESRVKELEEIVLFLTGELEARG